LKGYDDFCE